MNSGRILDIASATQTGSPWERSVTCSIQGFAVPGFSVQSLGFAKKHHVTEEWLRVSTGRAPKAIILESFVIRVPALESIPLS